MLKEKILPVSILCLSVSIIISASIIAKGMKINGEHVGTGLANIGSGLNGISSTINQSNIRGISKENYDLFEASAYLGVSDRKLEELVNNKDTGIPYIRIAGNYVFNKNALDKWLETARVEM